MGNTLHQRYEYIFFFYFPKHIVMTANKMPFIWNVWRYVVDSCIIQHRIYGIGKPHSKQLANNI